MTSFNLYGFLKTPSSNIVTLGIRASTYKFWEDKISSIAITKCKRTEYLDVPVVAKCKHYHIFSSAEIHTILESNPNMLKTNFCFFPE